MKKINLKVAVKELSRRELKIMMAGSGPGVCPTTTCTSNYICGNLSGLGDCSCTGTGGSIGVCQRHG